MSPEKREDSAWDMELVLIFVSQTSYNAMAVVDACQ